MDDISLQSTYTTLSLNEVGLVVRKPVYGVSDKVRFKPDAQDGPHLCCLQTSEDRFSRIEAQIRSKLTNITLNQSFN